MKAGAQTCSWICRINRPWNGSCSHVFALTALKEFESAGLDFELVFGPVKFDIWKVLKVDSPGCHNFKPEASQTQNQHHLNLLEVV